MKRFRRIVCITLSASMIFFAAATGVFGETIDTADLRNCHGSSDKTLKVQEVDTGNRFPVGDNSLLFPIIKINRKTAKIGRNDKLRLKAFYYPPTQKRKSFRWSSTNQKVATVTTEGVVKGVRPGRADITVSLRSNPRVRAVCKVTVGYTIKYQTKGGRLARRSPRVYYNERVVLKEPVRRGYEFKGWYTNSRRTKKITYIAKGAERNYTLYAKWKKVG